MERLKSASIVILAITAIVLMSLNLGLNPMEILINEDEGVGKIFDSAALFADGILPEEIVINFGGNEHTVVHTAKTEGLWDQSTEILKEIFGTEGYYIQNTTKINDQYYYSFLKQKSIILRFSSRINLNTILNALNIGDYIDLTEEFHQVDSIFISLEKPFIIIDSNGEKTLLSIIFMDTMALESIVDRVFQEGYRSYYIGKDRFGGDEITFIPYTTDQKIEVIEFESVLNGLDYIYIENIIYQFFKKEVNQLREINDAFSTIYTDGEKTLKIGRYGRIAFFDPQPVLTKERNLYKSIDYALEFISNNLGYDDTLYLREIEEIELNENPGYNLKFSKMVGDFRVKLKHAELEDYVVMDVYNDQTRHFNQLLRGKKESTNPAYIDLEEKDDIAYIVENNMSQINQRLGQDYTIEELLAKIEYARLVYVDNGFSPVLSIAWDLTIMGQDFYFEIY